MEMPIFCAFGVELNSIWQHADSPYRQWPTLLGVAGTAAATAAGEPLGWGTTGAPSAPWWEDRPASLTSPDREEDRLSRDACSSTKGSDEGWNGGRKGKLFESK